MDANVEKLLDIGHELVDKLTTNEQFCKVCGRYYRANGHDVACPVKKFEKLEMEIEFYG